LDVAVLTGPGLDPGPYRWGGLLRGFIGVVPRVPGVLGVVSVRYATRPGDLDATWLSGSFGMGARVGGGETAPLSAELTGELAFERLFLAARNPLTGHEDSSAENRFGGRLGLTLAWALWPSFALMFGGETTAMRPQVNVSVAGDRAGREPLVNFDLAAGVRFTR
jgi:hypothetical protein